MKTRNIFYKYILKNFRKIINKISCWKYYIATKNILIYCLRQLTFRLAIRARKEMDYNGIPPAELVNSSSDSESESSGSDSENINRSLYLKLMQFHGLQKPYKFRPYTLQKLHYDKYEASIDYPVPRSGHRIIASDANLYSLGGYNPRSVLHALRRGVCLLFQELWCYNFATNRWKLLLNNNLGTMPTELASIALAIHNNVLISHGGTGYPFGESCSNDCYIYSTDRPLVTRLNVQGDLPRAQYGPGIVIHENFLYTIGGTTGFDYSCDVYRLNLTSKVWECVYICRPEMRDDPEGRYRHEVVYDGKHIFVLGGGTSDFVYDLQKIPAFNLELNRWDYFETLPDPTVANGFPSARKCFSCVQNQTTYGIEAFITGGLQCDSRTYFADIWKINLKTLQWTMIKTAKLPHPLYFHSATPSGNGCMYIFGGIEYKKPEMRRRNELFKMWITIPKLSEICWDAITYYNPNLDVYSRSYLKELGIPEHFVQRLPQQKLPKKSANGPSSSTVPNCSPLTKRVRCLSQ